MSCFVNHMKATFGNREGHYITSVFAENLMNGRTRGQIVSDFIVRNVVKG